MVQDYIVSHPVQYRVPCRELLFGKLDISDEQVVPIVTRSTEESSTTISLA